MPTGDDDGDEDDGLFDAIGDLIRDLIKGYTGGASKDGGRPPIGGPRGPVGVTGPALGLAEIAVKLPGPFAWAATHSLYHAGAHNDLIFNGDLPDVNIPNTDGIPSGP